MLVDSDRTKDSHLTVEDVFSLLSEHLPGYEYRSEQLKLAHLIDRGFSAGEVGIFEAGTGTGKSLAALVPAILSGKRVVISTATIALQEQYINKDIPSLQAILPFEVRATLVKGRGNYLGIRRFEDYLKEASVDERIEDWANDTTTGDISELEFVPARDTWMEINSDSDDCLRDRCPSVNDCYYFRARAFAKDAHLLVVNHALLLADANSGGSILPEYDYLIVDEAQHLPTIATNAFSKAISNRGIKILCSTSVNKLQAPIQIVKDLEMEAEGFFINLEQLCKGLKTRFRESVDGAQYLHETLTTLKTWLEKADFENILDVDMAREKAKLKANGLVSTINGYLHCLDLLIEPNPRYVVWAERDFKKSRLDLVAAPLDVSDKLRKEIFQKSGLVSSVWMSATLATGGTDPFAFFKRQVGAPEGVVQDKVSSPFDYRQQSVLYLPGKLPEPNHPEFVFKAADEIEKILQLSDGRAFVLFTSYSAMNNAFNILNDRLPFPCKKQGDVPRKKLLDWFRETPQAVLFGTASFWEGVSVDGDQLSCVIIDRIPFQAPDDPVYEARCEALQKDGQNTWFGDLALPHATMRLKQGVGRLIRTSTDTGMVAILDPRLTTKHYGRSILQALPPMSIVKSLSGYNTLQDVLESVN